MVTLVVVLFRFIFIYIFLYFFFNFKIFLSKFRCLGSFNFDTVNIKCVNILYLSTCHA